MEPLKDTLTDIILSQSPRTERVLGQGIDWTDTGLIAKVAGEIQKHPRKEQLLETCGARIKLRRFYRNLGLAALTAELFFIPMAIYAARGASAPIALAFLMVLPIATAIWLVKPHEQYKFYDSIRNIIQNY